MDTSRSHEAHGLEAVDFIIHSIASNKTTEFALVPVNPSGGDGEGLKWMPAQIIDHNTGEKQKLENPLFLY